jgi:hypothetical protein
MDEERDFGAFARLNLPNKKSEHIRAAFELIWLAHRIYPTMYPADCADGGLTKSHYKQLLQDLEKQLTDEAGREITLKITEDTIDIACSRMRAAGYLRYVPYTKTFYFTKRAANSLRKLADRIDSFQNPAADKRACRKLIEDYKFERGEVKP